MKIKFYLLLFAFVSICSLLNAVTYHIKQDGTGNFTTIQAGIDACANSDTLLVFPGTYFENLVIIEKYMTIGSLYLTTGDESYISQTIIDGFENESVIRIESVETQEVYICGFIIQHGIGYMYHSNRPDLRRGGGIFLDEADATIKKCFIQYNKAAYGGGISQLDYSNITLIGNTIRYNRAFKDGGGICMVINNNINYSVEMLNNIYCNNAGVGSDILVSHWCSFQEIVVDTFTVADPAEGYYFIWPASNGAGYPQPNLFSIQIQNAKIEQVECDLYVSPDGSNSNSGISPSNPLQSIAYALAKIRSDSLIQRTIYVADGVYSPSINEQYFPLHIKSYVDIVGESRENTILDAEFEGGHFYALDAQSKYKIQNLKLINSCNGDNFIISENTNVVIKNIRITDHVDNIVDATFSGFYMNFTDISVENIIIENNYFNSAIYLYSPKFGTNFNIVNCILKNNNPSFFGNKQLFCYRTTALEDSLIVNVVNTEITDNLDNSFEWLPATSAILIAWETKLNLVNCTIGNNETLETGAAVQLCDESEANIVNSIVYGNTPHEICLDDREGPNILNCWNSLIAGGEAGIYQPFGYSNIINWNDETMLDEDPLWLGPGYDWPYALSANSPCIDTGTLDLPYGVLLPAYDLAGNPRVCGSAIDMGAYEFPGNAAPIYLEMDNETLSWQMPEGFSPTGYNIYLDDLFQATQSSLLSSFSFTNLFVGDTYKAGVSALYGTEGTAIISHYFVYQPVGIEEESSQLSPLTTQLSNYPNPFNPETNIIFNLPEEGYVQLDIYNIKGQKIKTLVQNEFIKGSHSVIWDGIDEYGKTSSSGIYYYMLNVNGKTKAVKKCLLLK